MKQNRTRSKSALIQALKTVLATIATVITIAILTIVLPTYAELISITVRILLITAVLIGVPAILWWRHFSEEETDG